MKPNSIIQTSDGGYAIVGSTRSFGSGGLDVYVLKLDQAGKVQWERTFGGSKDDVGYSIIRTLDGGYAIAGSTASFGSGEKDGFRTDVYVLKLDGFGNLQWTRTITAEGKMRAEGHSIVQTSDGGYAVAGTAYGMGDFMNDDVYLIKLDAGGNIQWQRMIDGGGDDKGHSITQTSDGGYVVVGGTQSGDGMGNGYVAKLDKAGKVQWERSVGGPGPDEFYSITPGSDGGYVIAGRMISFGAGEDGVYVIKLSNDGKVQWERTLGGSGWEGYSIIQTSDGGYAVAGKTGSSENRGTGVYVLKLDQAGKVQWERTFGGSKDDVGYSIIQTSDGGYAIVGTTESFGSGGKDIYVLKLDADGQLRK